MEPEKTFSANFWEVKQAGFRKLPSKGRGVSEGAEEVALALSLSLSSQTGNYYWPPDPTHPSQPPPRSLEAVTEQFLPSFAEEDELERVLPGAGAPVAAGAGGIRIPAFPKAKRPEPADSPSPNWAPWPSGWPPARHPTFDGAAKILFPAFFLPCCLFQSKQTNGGKKKKKRKRNVQEFGFANL